MAPKIDARFCTCLRLVNLSPLPVSSEIYSHSDFWTNRKTSNLKPVREDNNCCDVCQIHILHDCSHYLFCRSAENVILHMLLTFGSPCTLDITVFLCVSVWCECTFRGLSYNLPLWVLRCVPHSELCILMMMLVTVQQEVPIAVNRQQQKKKEEDSGVWGPGMVHQQVQRRAEAVFGHSLFVLLSWAGTSRHHLYSDTVCSTLCPTCAYAYT